MTTSSGSRARHRRFRRFVAWYVAVLGGFMTMFVGLLVLWAYVDGGSIVIYTDRFGEARAELVLFAVVCGTVPYGLYLLDELLLQRE